MLYASYQGVKRLFVLSYWDCGGANRVTADSCRRYLLSTVKIQNHSIEINGRDFYDQSINNLIKQYHEVRKNWQDKVIITQLLVSWILLILKKNTD